MAETSSPLDPGAVPLGKGEFFSPAYLEARRLAMEQAPAPADMDEFDPKLPAGHAYAIRTSTRLTSYTKSHQRKAAMDITPQDVIDVLNGAGVKNWVLIGLHGYVGYMPSPRATQDVDIMVPRSERHRAKKAIVARWPELVIRELSQVIRFMDPSDLDSEGNPKPLVDLMHPWSPFQELILKEYVIVDEQTQHRLPTVEAALVSKYAAFVSPHRSREKKNTTRAISDAWLSPTAIAFRLPNCVVWPDSCGKEARKKSSDLSKSHSRTSRFRFELEGRGVARRVDSVVTRDGCDFSRSLTHFIASRPALPFLFLGWALLGVAEGAQNSSPLAWALIPGVFVKVRKTPPTNFAHLEAKLNRSM